MRYIVLSGGKRVRPALLFAAARAVGLTEEEVEAAACAVELVHVYSLVHDDLPRWMMMICVAVARPVTRLTMRPRPSAGPPAIADLHLAGDLCRESIRPGRLD